MNYTKPGDIAPSSYVAPQPVVETPSLEQLTYPPGLVGELTNLGAARSMRRTRLPALAGALAAVSALSGRKYAIEGYGMRTSLGLQVMCVAGTGMGKDIMFDVSSEVATASGDTFSMSQPASVAGLHRLLSEHPTLLWRVDEFGRYLEVAIKGSGHDFQLLTKMMELHTSFFKIWGKRQYSDSGKNLDPVTHPLMVGLFATTPGQFLNAMDKGTVVDGLLGRMLVLRQTGDVEAVPLAERRWTPMPDNLRSAIAGIATLLPPKEHGLNGIDGHTFWPVRFDEQANAMLQSIHDDVDKRGTDELERSLWVRSFEQIIRVAGVVALGEAAILGLPFSPVINATTLHWSHALVTHSIAAMLPDVKDHAAGTDLERLQNAVIRAMKKHMAETGDMTVRKTDLIYRLKGRGRTYHALKDAIEGLVDANVLLLTLRGKAGVGGSAAEFLTLNGGPDVWG
ncbi:hypothetical protein [Ruegeria arenilitoris]|uniref:hypothetical protein n=1 Tax=Ruegeria arenilitoris TaxID=1173585 RepID=UPI00147DCC71|nr:hypothetical protein [Ruegeria arenilitoris]